MFCLEMGSLTSKSAKQNEVTVKSPRQVITLVHEEVGPECTSRDSSAPPLSSYLNGKGEVFTFDASSSSTAPSAAIDMIPFCSDIFIPRDIAVATIGRGSSAVVLGGRLMLTKSGVDVALKCIPKGNVVSMSRIDSEVHALILLKGGRGILRLHRVLEVYGESFAHGSIVLVTDLGECILKHAMTVTANLVSQIIDAMAYAHSHGVCHRDLCPENIFIVNGMAVIGDWGHSAVFGEEWDIFDEVGVGHPLHVAPEQIHGHPYSGTALDVWSFGVTLFRLFCGRSPFGGSPAPSGDEEEGEGVQRMLDRVSAVSYSFSDDDPDVPDPIKSLIKKCLVANPEQRPSFEAMKKGMMKEDIYF